MRTIISVVVIVTMEKLCIKEECTGRSKVGESWATLFAVFVGHGQRAQFRHYKYSVAWSLRRRSEIDYTAFPSRDATSAWLFLVHLIM